MCLAWSLFLVDPREVMCSEFSWSGQLYGNSTSSGTRSIYKGRETMEVTYPRSRNGQSDALVQRLYFFPYNQTRADGGAFQKTGLSDQHLV